MSAAYEPASPVSASLLSDEAMSSYGTDEVGRWLRESLPYEVRSAEARGHVSTESFMLPIEVVARCRLSGEPIPATLLERDAADGGCSPALGGGRGGVPCR